jgi:hypothetical protein
MAQRQRLTRVAQDRQRTQALISCHNLWTGAQGEELQNQNQCHRQRSGRSRILGEKSSCLLKVSVYLFGKFWVLAGNATNAVNDIVNKLLANGVVPTSIYLLSAMSYS